MEIAEDICYTKDENTSYWGKSPMGLLPMDLDILPPSDDRVFKLLLTSPEAKPGLINLISGLIGRNVVDVMIYANELPPGDTDEKAERFDVNCKIDDGSQVNIEMQSSRMKEDLDGQHRNLKGKSIYYLTDLHSSQPAKGMRRYDHLARSYQITFCSYTVFPNQPNYVNSFSMRHDTTGELLSDAIHITFVELSKLSETLKKPVRDMTTLDKWSVFFQYAPDPAYREAVNRIIASEEVLTVAGELLMGISQNEKERAIFRSRRKFQTDLQSDLATAEDVGKQIGRAEGRAEGKLERNTEIAKSMLSDGLPLETVMRYTGLTQKEIERLCSD